MNQRMRTKPMKLMKTKMSLPKAKVREELWTLMMRGSVQMQTSLRTSNTSSKGPCESRAGALWWRISWFFSKAVLSMEGVQASTKLLWSQYLVFTLSIKAQKKIGLIQHDSPSILRCTYVTPSYELTLWNWKLNSSGFFCSEVLTVRRGN